MIAGLAVLIIVIAGGIISTRYIGPKILLMPDRRGPDFYRKRYGFGHPSEIGLKYKDGTIVTDDGLKLRYWMVEPSSVDGPKSCVIFLHGITDSKASGLNYARELSGLGHRVYLLDMRSHGESEGKYCTYGYYEKKDVSKLIDAIMTTDPAAEITLLGVSMGAAVALQAASADNRVSRVIAIAPFYDLFSIALDHQVKRIGFRSKLMMRFVLRRAEKIADFNASEVSPANEIVKIHVPVLIVHGESDKTVKREYSTTLQSLNHGVRLLTIPGAGHVDVLEKGGKDYIKALEDFLTTT